jgi:hypothetical protein
VTKKSKSVGSRSAANARRNQFSSTMPQRAIRKRANTRKICLALLVLYIDSRCAATEFGPCTTAAPTTPAVVAFASHIDKSLRWYRENIGLEISETGTGPRTGGSITLTARNGTGVTLSPSPGMEQSPRDPQVVCFVLDEPPAPSPGSKPVFLADPDGTSVELPPRKASTRN